MQNAGPLLPWYHLFAGVEPGLSLTPFREEDCDLDKQGHRFVFLLHDTTEAAYLPSLTCPAVDRFPEGVDLLVDETLHFGVIHTRLLQPLGSAETV